MRHNATKYTHTLAEAAKLVRSWPEFSHIHPMATYAVRLLCECGPKPYGYYYYDEGYFYTHFDVRSLYPALCQAFGRDCRLCGHRHYDGNENCVLCLVCRMFPVMRKYSGLDENTKVSLIAAIMLSKYTPEEITKISTAGRKNMGEKLLCNKKRIFGYPLNNGGCEWIGVVPFHLNLP